MHSSNSPEINPIENFTEDEIYFDLKKRREPLEKGTITLYVMASLSLLFTIVGLLLSKSDLDWYGLAITLLIICGYFSIAVYSSQKPFNAFVATISLLAVGVVVGIIFSNQISVVKLLVRVLLIVYFSSLLESAKIVQAFDSRNKK